MSDDLAAVPLHFQIDGRLRDVRPYGTGHINRTYCSTFETPAGRRRFVHQQINTRIFRQPDKLMENIRRVTEHLQAKVRAEGGDPAREALTLVPARDGGVVWRDPAGEVWRTYRFIEGARTYDVVEQEDHVRAAGAAFARFQRRLADLPGPRLHETIAHFGDTRARFEQFEAALAADAAGRAAEARADVDFALARRHTAPVLMELLESGRVPERITHYDTKFNNVMIDDATGEGVCVIDLDTVMPGVILYDFGDAVRQTANPAAEDEGDLAKVRLNLGRFELLTRGYLGGAREFLTDVEVDHLAFAARLITFTIGLRFLTDHLSGDVYFRVHRAGHNLDRCRTQFHLVRQMEERADEIDAIINRYR